MNNSKENQSSKPLNILLWIAQYLLAIIFMLAGTMKATQPVEDLARLMSWVNYVSPFLVRFAGISEILGALGLFVPSVLKVRPKLVVLSSLALVVMMICATILHILIGEWKMIALPITLILISAFIAWGRS